MEYKVTVYLIVEPFVLVQMLVSGFILGTRITLMIRGRRATKRGIVGLAGIAGVFLLHLHYCITGWPRSGEAGFAPWHLAAVIATIPFLVSQRPLWKELWRDSGTSPLGRDEGWVKRALLYGAATTVLFGTLVLVFTVAERCCGLLPKT